MADIVFDRVESLLKQHGIAFQVLRHEPVYTSEEAARVRGTPLAIETIELYRFAEGRLAVTYFIRLPPELAAAAAASETRP